jgi:hypothetical protein
MRLLRNFTQSDPYGAAGWLLVASGGLLFAAEDAQPLGPVFTARRCAWEQYADTSPGSVPSGNSTASDYWREVQVSALCCQVAPQVSKSLDLACGDWGRPRRRVHTYGRTAG